MGPGLSSGSPAGTQALQRCGLCRHGLGLGAGAVPTPARAGHGGPRTSAARPPSMVCAHHLLFLGSVAGTGMRDGTLPEFRLSLGADTLSGSLRRGRDPSVWEAGTCTGTRGWGSQGPRKAGVGGKTLQTTEPHPSRGSSLCPGPHSEAGRCRGGSSRHVGHRGSHGPCVLSTRREAPVRPGEAGRGPGGKAWRRHQGLQALCSAPGQRSPSPARCGSPWAGKARPTPGCEAGTRTFQQGSSSASTGKKGVEHVSGRLGSANRDWSPQGPV